MAKFYGERTGGTVKLIETYEKLRQEYAEEIAARCGLLVPEGKSKIFHSEDLSVFDKVNIAKSLLIKFDKPDVIRWYKYRLDKAASVLLEDSSKGLDEFEWRELTPEKAEKILKKDGADGNASSTLMGMYRVLLALVKEGIRLGQMTAQTFEGVYELKEKIPGFVKAKPQEKERPGDAEEVVKDEELVGALEKMTEKKSCKELRNAALLVLMRCGLKRSEIIALNYEDIDFDENSITIITREEGEDKVEIPEKFRPFLDPWKEKTGRIKDKQPFLHRLRKDDTTTYLRLYPRSLSPILNSVCSEYGLPRMKIKHFRVLFSEKSGSRKSMHPKWYIKQLREGSSEEENEK